MTTRHVLVLVGMSVLIAAQLFAQAPGTTAPRLAGFSSLLRKPEFRTDLEIVDDQYTELQSIYRERGKFLASDPAEMTPEQRRAYLATFMARQAEFEQRAEEILLPHQMRRFEQLRQQQLIDAQGPTAGLNHPRMMEQTKPTDAQIEKIRATAEATNAKLKEKIEKREREMEDARNEARRVILGELADEQRRLYQDVVGEIADYSLATAQVPGIPVRRVPGFTSLVRKPEFRKDLEIVDDQYKEIQTILDERAKFTRSGNLAEMTLEQRRTFMSSYSVRMAEFEKRAEEVLVPHQKRRLGQLRQQGLIDAQGPTLGLTDPRMIEQFKLSDAQIEKIAATADATNAKLKENIAKLEQEINQARDDARRVILGELTDEQRRLYFDALGEIANYSLR